MKAMPEVLRLLGEAAQVDRTALAFAEIGPNGEKWLKIQAEWITESLERCALPLASATARTLERAALRPVLHHAAGRQERGVLPRRLRAPSTGVSITSDKARTSAIVPILVDGEYVGVIGFDDWQRVREFDSSIVSALEIAAGLVGAALHRERLLETMRRERELAAEERLSSADARQRAAARRISRGWRAMPTRRTSSRNILLDATRQLDAAAAYTIGFDTAANHWQLLRPRRGRQGGSAALPGHRHAGRNPHRARCSSSSPNRRSIQLRAARPHPVARRRRLACARRPQECLSTALVVGEQTVGCIGLVFRQDEALSTERAELALAVAHQITLCIGLKKLGMAAKDAAVLAERNRIGQEIHDGLAQGFTGILMQLGAAEEAMHECARNSPLPAILTRIRDLAQAGPRRCAPLGDGVAPRSDRRVGLELALRQLAERATVDGRVTCSFEGAVIGDGLVPERQHELLRIAQEAVSNALRHAHPANGAHRAARGRPRSGPERDRRRPRHDADARSSTPSRATA